MPNVMPDPSFFARRFNMYVPAMQYSADVNHNGMTRVNFGAPQAANASLVASALSIAVAGTSDLSGVAQVVEKYGRNLTVVASGAATSNVTVNGLDYLCQPLQESFTLTGATPVVGNKAFKYFTNVTFGATAATTVNIGVGVKLGLPYKTIRCSYEIANGAVAAAGTLQNPVYTDPQTATTQDPRGMYTTTTTMNGTNIISAVFEMLNDVNVNNRGGLHGIAQFAG